MERVIAQPTFTDLTLADLGSRRAAAFFARCDELIPFARLAQSVSDIFVENQPRGGAPHWPVVATFACLARKAARIRELSHGRRARGLRPCAFGRAVLGKKSGRRLTRSKAHCPLHGRFA